VIGSADTRLAASPGRAQIPASIQTVRGANLSSMRKFTSSHPRLTLSLYLLFFLLVSQFAAAAQATAAPATRQAGTTAAVQRSRSTAKVCARCIRGHMEFLAGDALAGRGSGTRDELLAATYIASELRAYGIEPAGEEGGYLQRATILRRTVSVPPQLKFNNGSSAIVWTHGQEFLTLYLTQSKFSGPLRKINVDAEEVKIEPGVVVFLASSDKDKLHQATLSALEQGAAGALLPVSADRREHWHDLAKKLPTLPVQVEGQPENALGENYNILSLSDDAQKTLRDIPDGTMMDFESNAESPQSSNTWNVVGILRGQDPVQRKNVILLTAHLDHLGIGPPVNGDNIYNGADDDASGTTAVLELARVLGSGPKPRRTVIFALFGSEETGGLGSTYFREHPPVPLHDIVANLEFEMIGRADPKIAEDALWLSGWERSNLGPQLAVHGAKLVGDPHPEQGFFRRSDNYVLAKKGVVAQTVSSFGLHKDYHQPSDDLVHIDFLHMTNAVASLIAPVEWLVNSDFIPKWNAGGKP
jgi:peptidase M28-like protein